MITLTTEERDLLAHALWRARSDIWQTARVSEYNLTGKDPAFPDDAPNEIPNPPRQIHRAGVDESYRVVALLEEVAKMLATKQT